MKTKKRKILIPNFDARANFYEKNAYIQRKIAQEFISKLISFSFTPNNILEIGAGTGFLTQYLLQKYHPQSITLNDLSPNMLKINLNKIKAIYSGNNFKTSPIIRTIIGDFQEIKLTQKYDFIVSNLCFQWFSNLEQVIAKISQHLTDKGILAFTTLIDGTFQNLKQTFQNAYLAQNLIPQDNFLPLLTRSQIEQILNIYKFKMIDLQTYIHKIQPQCPISFLKTLHQIGANSNIQSNTPIKLLKSIKKQNLKMSYVYKIQFTIMCK